MSAQSPTQVLLDAYDVRILAELQAEARMTLAELGRRVHLSQPAVAERVRKLEAAGVITGYRASVNLAALGYGIRAMVRVGRTDYSAMVQLIAKLPEVVNAWNITGEDSWALEIAVADVAHLAALPAEGGLILCHPGEAIATPHASADPIAAARVRELAYLGSAAFTADLSAAAAVLYPPVPTQSSSPG